MTRWPTRSIPHLPWPVLDFVAMFNRYVGWLILLLQKTATRQHIFLVGIDSFSRSLFGAFKEIGFRIHMYSDPIDFQFGLSATLGPVRGNAWERRCEERIHFHWVVEREEERRRGKLEREK